MMFFKLVFTTLAAILLLNLIQVAVEMSLRDSVYACSDLGKYVPLEVQKKCRRAR